MGESESISIVPSSETSGQFRPVMDKNVRRYFGEVCKVLWPDPLKPDAELASIGKVDPRTARRWMAGERDDVPWPVIKAVIDRMFEPITD